MYFARSVKREIISLLLRITAVVLTIVLLFLLLTSSLSSFSYISDGSCNIAVVPIEGVILPFSGLTEFGDLVITPGEIKTYLEAVQDDPYIKAVLFEINSPGGTPVASETISELIKEFSLPTVAVIGDIGASGGYMVASAADRIVASRMSDIGGIGVTMSYVEESQKNEEEGRTFVSLATGAFKDAGNPDKPLTDEERAIFETQLAAVHEAFIDIVAQNRNLATERVAELANGSTLTGLAAKEAGLIDEIGGRTKAKEMLSELLGEDMDTDDITFCEYNPYLGLW